MCHAELWNTLVGLLEMFAAEDDVEEVLNALPAEMQRELTEAYARSPSLLQASSSPADVRRQIGDWLEEYPEPPEQ